MSFLFCGDAPLLCSGASYLCLGAPPLLYPAAPPSVFAYYIVKYTASAVALVREMASNQMPFLVEMGLTKQSVAYPLRGSLTPAGV